MWAGHGEIYLGHFADAAQAGRTYDRAAIRCAMRRSIRIASFKYYAMIAVASCLRFGLS